MWIRLPKHKWPRSWDHIEDPVVPPASRTKLVRTPTRRAVGKTVRKSIELGWEKVPNWECLFAHRKQMLFLSVHVDDIKMAGKKQNLAPVCKNSMKNVDIEEPTSFLDHVYLGCTQRECKPIEKIIGQYNKMFESRNSAGATEKLPG